MLKAAVGKLKRFNTKLIMGVKSEQKIINI